MDPGLSQQIYWEALAEQDPLFPLDHRKVPPEPFVAPARGKQLRRWPQARPLLSAPVAEPESAREI